jgi:hypothetical protein
LVGCFLSRLSLLKERHKKGPMPLLLRANGKGPLSNFKPCKSMKSNRFFVLFFLLIAANAVTYFSSCRQDEAATLTPNPTGDMSATYRTCTDDSGCSYVITATANCTVDLCGDVIGAMTACAVGCGSNANDRSLTVPLTMGTPHSFCVEDAGSVCVFNPGMADITVSVNVAGTSGPPPITIPAGQRSCFSSDDNCTVTNNYCY